MSLEINMVVSCVKDAVEFYSEVFNADIILRNDELGNQSEAVISIDNVQIRLMNENSDYGLNAATPDMPRASWLNLIVDDINEFFEKAISLECSEIQPVTEHKEANAVNAVILDKFNHVWVINQNVKDKI